MKFVARLGVALLAGTSLAAAQAGVIDLDGRAVHPLQRGAGRSATVLLFLSTECPISNRYAPEIQRLHSRFADRGIRLWLVYPHPSDAAATIRDHIRNFSFPGRAVRDWEQTLVRLAKITVTPEAAVFDAGGTLRYRGRIDDRYTDFGVDRQTPTRRDLEDAIAAVLAGRRVPEPVTRAVGCFLADLP